MNYCASAQPAPPWQAGNMPFAAGTARAGRVGEGEVTLTHSPRGRAPHSCRSASTRAQALPTGRSRFPAPGRRSEIARPVGIVLGAGRHVVDAAVASYPGGDLDAAVQSVGRDFGHRQRCARVAERSTACGAGTLATRSAVLRTRRSRRRSDVSTSVRVSSAPSELRLDARRRASSRAV